jgi:hypothetical protein
MTKGEFMTATLEVATTRAFLNLWHHLSAPPPFDLDLCEEVAANLLDLYDSLLSVGAIFPQSVTVQMALVKCVYDWQFREQDVGIEDLPHE